MQTITILVRSTKRTVDNEKLGWEMNSEGKMVWLQKLAMKVLRRFGREAVVPMPRVETIRVPVSYDNIIAAAQAQIADLKCLNMEPLCIYLGHNFVQQWRDGFLREHLVDFSPTEIPFNYGDHLSRFAGVTVPGSPHDKFKDSMLGLPLVLVPNFEGVFVAPRL